MTDAFGGTASDMSSDDFENPPAPEDVARLRDSARRELAALAAEWDGRIAAFDVLDAGDVAVEQRSLLGDAARRFMASRIAVTGLSILTIYIVLAIVVPIVDQSSITQDFSQQNLGPSFAHPFGTDDAGKDVWNRVWIGARISLSIGFAVAFMILAMGVTYGAIAGYVGGRLDSVMMRLLDALYGLPSLPFAIIAVAVVRDRFPDANPLWYLVPALSLTTWFTAARIMRGQMLSLKELDFVESARANGAGGARIVARHVVPNTIGLMVVVIFLEIPGAIIGEATLSFLGLGVSTPDTSWGQMAFDYYQAISVHPALIWIPAFFIATTVLSAIAIGDGLRDALDPRGRVN